MIPKLLSDNAPGAGKPHGYRRDIDGLRAIAVLSVVAFHFGEHFMPGGYLGVDVFFVLSGYLITGIIVREAGEGRFSIARFYERRIRRIAPALLFALTATTGFAALILLPLDLEGYGESLIASLAFVANIYFWRDGNYFAQGSETKPLLHIWSLGVEEQFYIFFPLLVMLLASRKGWLFATVVGTVAVSFVLNVWSLRAGYASPAFYLLPTRAWELGAGALLVFLPKPAIARGTAEALMAISYVMLIAAIIAAPLWVPHPIPTALPAVFATALLIWVGSAGAPTALSGPLKTAPMVGVGLISYSLYLWHWPVIVLAKYYLVDAPGPLMILALLAVMFLAAWASWRFVEKPFRSKDFPVRKLYWITGGWALALALAGLAFVQSGGFPSRLPQSVAQVNAAIGSHYRCSLADTKVYAGVRSCWFGEGDPATADTVLLGNSHAQMYAPILRDQAETRGENLLMIPANGCAPLTGINIRPGCIAVAEANIEAAAKHPEADTVMIAFAWHIAEDLVDPSGEAPADPAQALIAGLDRTIDTLRAEGKQVVVIGPIAVPDYELPSVVSRANAFGRDSPYPIERAESDFLTEFAPYLDHFRARGDIKLLEPHRAQCQDGVCRYMADGKSLFADKTHISRDGLEVFAPVFDLESSVSRGRTLSEKEDAQ